MSITFDRRLKRVHIQLIHTAQWSYILSERKTHDQICCVSNLCYPDERQWNTQFQSHPVDHDELWKNPFVCLVERCQEVSMKVDIFLIDGALSISGEQRDPSKLYIQEYTTRRLHILPFEQVRLPS